MAWIIENNVLTNSDFTSLSEPITSLPYPDGMWRVENNTLTTAILNTLIIPTQLTAPCPNSMWRVENGELVHNLLPSIEPLGAFANAINLKNVIIPQSVKKIGSNSFFNTALTSVEIANDCEYFNTTFPSNCEVTFYEE